MALVALGAAGFLAAFCLYLAIAKDRAIEALLKDQALERGGWNAERVNLIAAADEERKAWAIERRDLNNRIQVPEAAPYMTPGTEAPPLQHVPFDDDEAFAKAREELGNEWPS